MTEQSGVGGYEMPVIHSFTVAPPDLSSSNTEVEGVSQDSILAVTKKFRATALKKKKRMWQRLDKGR